MILEILIQGDPKGQPRPRAFARNMGGRYVARVYDSDVADEWKRRVDAELLRAVVHMGIQASEQAFRVTMNFGLKRPMSHFNAAGEVKKAHAGACMKKPDVDNLAKLVLDRITRSQRIWQDDSQVIELLVTKVWTIKPQGYCRLTIERDDANCLFNQQE